MREVGRLLRGGHEPAPRAVRRGVGVAVVLLVVGITVIAGAKHAALGSLSEHEVDAGVTELVMALRDGSAAGFDSAERHFLDAASVSVVDTYPSFLIHSGRRLRALRAGQKPDGTVADAIAASVAEGDLESARSRAGTLRVESPRAAAHWQRFIDAIESVPE